MYIIKNFFKDFFKSIIDKNKYRTLCIIYLSLLIKRKNMYHTS